MVQSGSRRRGIAALLAALFAVCVTVIPAGPVRARARHQGRHHKTHKAVGACNAHREHAAVVTPRVLVYGKATGNDMYDSPLTTYYACLRPRGHSSRVGVDAPGDGEYPANETTGGFRVAGSYVAADSSSGLADAAGCSKFEPVQSCPTPVNWIQVVDARTGRHMQIPLGPYGAGAITLAPGGAVAWIAFASPTLSALYAMVLRRGDPGRLTGSTQTLDTGAARPKSLHWNGLTVSWTDAGQPHSATLH